MDLPNPPLSFKQGLDVPAPSRGQGPGKLEGTFPCSVEFLYPLRSLHAAFTRT